MKDLLWASVIGLGILILSTVLAPKAFSEAYNVPLVTRYQDQTLISNIEMSNDLRVVACFRKSVHDPIMCFRKKEHLFGDVWIADVGMARPQGEPNPKIKKLYNMNYDKHNRTVDPTTDVVD